MGDERPSGRLTGRDRPQTDGGDDRSIKESCPPPRECAKTLNGDLSSGTGLKGVPADRETAPKGEFRALEDWNSAFSAAPSSPPFTPIINATHVAQMLDLRRIWLRLSNAVFKLTSGLASELRRPRPPSGHAEYNQCHIIMLGSSPGERLRPRPLPKLVGQKTSSADASVHRDR